MNKMRDLLIAAERLDKNNHVALDKIRTVLEECIMECTTMNLEEHDARINTAITEIKKILLEELL